MPKVTPSFKIAITTGDSDGIGLEVTLKSLLLMPIKSNVQYFVFRQPSTPRSLVKTEQAVLRRFNSDKVHFMHRNTAPPYWVHEAAEGCLLKKFDALATAPMSKEIIRASGVRGIGHTDILKNITSSKSVHMAFLGNRFNVLLATGHIPISSVSKCLTLSALKASIVAANKVRLLLPKNKSKKNIALVGLNPHAGEGGIIGREESRLFQRALTFAKINKIPLIGPLVPDAAFFEENWAKYSLYITPYHDQGLIPFKMIHGRDSGIHLSVGLPFIRTSVDHGTAKDIFGKNMANAHSMAEALIWAETLGKRNKHGI
ncbi:MAG: 4-hydroxythreonine-4-phosphate dehydrogenase PdxA [Bdellovibrionales bacterium]|nr:4-hydroxythreonine-4-phosphate dehydrogenase PdxA [Bdellovibrionales bacterium]